MKILILTQYFWPENFQINSLANALKKKHDVTVLTGLPNYPKGKIYAGYLCFWPFKENKDGIKIIRTPIVSRGNGKNWRLLLNYLSFAFFSTICALFLCREKYDVIFIFEPSPITQALAGIFLRKIKKIPAIIWVQDLWPESLVATNKIKAPVLLKLTEKFVAFTYRHCDSILIQSRAFFPYILRHHVDPSKIRYFPNSADPCYKPLCLSNRNNKYNIPTGFRILFAGNLGSAQAIPTILAAAEQLKNHVHLKWIFAGEGSERVFLEEEIKQRNLENIVFWIGSFPNEEMPYLISQCDVLLISLAKKEIFSVTLPSKLQSYLASGKPILAAVDGETKNIIQEAKVGIAVPAENFQELADAALSLSNSSAQYRAELGENGFAYYNKHFQQEKLIEQLEEWFQTIKFSK